MSVKHIFVTGGVVSGLGKGITAASLGRLLKQRGHKTARYHAGLTPGERQAAQTAFIRGEVSVIAATSAFGMGIDKEDVSFVIHYSVFCTSITNIDS